MRKIWKEFKSFALGGSMLDLALGFIIGTAFATVVTAATDDLLTPLIGAIFGKKSLAGLHWRLHHSSIYYGLFVQAAINFVLFAAVLYFILKAVGALGVGRARVFQERECPYCLEFVNPEALVCRVCRNPLVDAMPDLLAAEARAAKLRQRHRIKIDLPAIDLPDLRNLPIPRRRRDTELPENVAVIPAVAAIVETEPGDLPVSPPEG